MGTKSVTRLGVITADLHRPAAPQRRARASAPWPASSSSNCSSWSTWGASSFRRGSNERNSFVLASGNITIGDHHERRGTWRASPSTATWCGPRSSRRPSSWASGCACGPRSPRGCPGKLQLFWETLVEQVSDLASSAIGPEGLPFVGLGVTVFLFVLVCNWLAFIPSGDPGLPGPADRRRQPAAGPGPHRLLPGALQLGQGAWLEGLLQALRPALRRADADQHHRGDHQADHADLPTLRQHLLGRADDRRSS